MLDSAPLARDALVTGTARVTRLCVVPVDVSQKRKVPLSILHRPCCPAGHHLSSSKSFWGAVGRNPAVSPFLHPN